MFNSFEQVLDNFETHLYSNCFKILPMLKNVHNTHTSDAQTPQNASKRNDVISVLRLFRFFENMNLQFDNLFHIFLPLRRPSLIL